MHVGWAAEVPGPCSRLALARILRFPRVPFALGEQSRLPGTSLPTKVYKSTYIDIDLASNLSLEFHDWKPRKMSFSEVQAWHFALAQVNILEIDALVSR